MGQWISHAAECSDGPLPRRPGLASTPHRHTHPDSVMRSRDTVVAPHGTAHVQRSADASSESGVRAATSRAGRARSALAVLLVATRTDVRRRRRTVSTRGSRGARPAVKRSSQDYFSKGEL
jgi:hypothetical protein